MSVLKAYLRGQSPLQSEVEHTCVSTDSLSPLEMLWYLFMLICGLPQFINFLVNLNECPLPSFSQATSLNLADGLKWKGLLTDMQSNQPQLVVSHYGI